MLVAVVVRVSQRKIKMTVNRISDTFIVTENCVKCKYTDCAEVCPVDCFYEGANFLVINPDECILCGVCVPECPADAIVLFDADSATDEENKYYDINVKYAAEWPMINERKDPFPDAILFDRLKGFDGPDKTDLIDPTAGEGSDE
mgnify:CR=1 FL=1